VQRPRFRTHLDVHVAADDLLVVVSPRGARVLEGRILPLLAPHLDGSTTRQELIERLGGLATPLDVDYGLHLLAENGLLIEGDAVEGGAEEPPPLPLFRDLLGLETLALSKRLATARVEIRQVTEGATGELAGELAAALSGLGLSGLGLAPADASGPPAGPGDLVVGLLGADLEEMLDDRPTAAWSELVEATRRDGRMLLPLRLGAGEAWLGPLLGEPPGGACWRCLRRRLRENRATELVARGAGPAVSPHTRSRLPGLAVLTAHVAASQIVRWLVDPERSPLADRLLVLDPLAPSIEGHAVSRQPGCEQCGGASIHDAANGPPALDPHAPAGRAHSDPGRTFERLRPLIGPLTGVVDRLDPAPRFGDWEAQTFFVEHSFVPASPRVEDLREGLRHASAGRGTTREQARTAALCEALERYSGLFRGTERRIEASYRELGERAIHPNACMLFSALQVQQRERWNRARHRYCWVPPPLPPDRVLEWSPVWSLSRGCERYLPTAQLYYRYPLEEAERYCFADSNGTAAGATLEEAVLRGFLELVERDCAALWWYNRIPRPPVAPDTLAPEVLALRERYARLGRSLDVLDITNDLGFPACAAVSFSHASGAPPGELLVGFGCELSAKAAATSAVTELHQFLPAAVGGSLRARFSSPPASEPFLRPDPRANGAGAARAQPPALGAGAAPSGAPAGTIAHCVEALARHGLELLVLDQTRADVGLPVAKVLAPGLRHFWPRLGPGRLYTVPVRLGWLERETPEDQLNPVQLLI
jgi:ribosomal protein S12 methylthiotransferase accessory factor